MDNKIKKIKCPYCGSTKTGEIQYGFPLYSEQRKEQIKSGELKLGGCYVRTATVNGKSIIVEPSKFCNNCKNRFGTPPVIYKNPHFYKEACGKDYRDMVTTIRFKTDYTGGFTQVTIEKNEKGALVKVLSICIRNENYSQKFNEKIQIPNDKWRSILDKLYSDMYLHEWNESYKNLNSPNGERWSLEITMEDQYKKIYSGSNAFPPYWPELKMVFMTYTMK